MQVLPHADRRAVPWKNGGGLTYPVADDSGGRGTSGVGGIESFRWRVSIARLEADGPFSIFAGVDRTITLLQGSPLALTIDTDRLLLQPWQPLAFSGDSVTSCRLTGAAGLDCNVMTRRAVASHRVVVVPAGGQLSVPAGTLVVVIVESAGEVVLGSARAALDPLDAVLAHPEPHSRVLAPLGGTRALAALIQPSR